MEKVNPKRETMKVKIDIHEKLGDFLLNLVQLAIGGIIFSTIMADKSISSSVLYLCASFVVIVLLTFAVVMYRMSNKNKK